MCKIFSFSILAIMCILLVGQLSTSNAEDWTQIPGAIWGDDFEDGSWLDWDEVDYPPPGIEGNEGVECGNLGATDDCSLNSGLFYQTNPAGWDARWGYWHGGWGSTELYARFYVYIADPFDWGSTGDKIFIFETDTKPGISGYVLTSMWNSGKPTITVYADGRNLYQNQGNDITLQPGHWYLFEYHKRLTTLYRPDGDTPNGIEELWVDDATVDPPQSIDEQTLRISYTDVQNRYPDTGRDAKIKGVWLSAYHNTDGVYPTQYVKWDNIVVGTQRIGPAGGSPPPDTTPPTVSSVSPTPDATGVPVNCNISFYIQDSGDGVDSNSIQLTVDGQQIAQSDLQITGSPADYEVVYDPPIDFDYDSVITVSIDTQDLHNPPNIMDAYAYTFTTTTQAEEPSTYTAVFGDATGCDHPGTIQDTFININSTNSERDTYLGTYTWPQDKVANAIVMKWDLSAIPSSAQIHNATLYLYLSDMDGGGGDDLYDLSVHKIINYNPVISACTGYTYDGTDWWTPYSGLYNNIPMAQADIAQAEDTEFIDKSYGYKAWTVTKMVQDWVSNPASNYGMLINSDPVASSDSNRYFSSTESQNPDQRPKLVITYSVGPAPPAPPTGVSITPQ